MSAGLKPLSHQETETFYVSRGAGEAEGTGRMRELTRVVVLADVITFEGDHVAAGSVGTIVAVWHEGDGYDVEFGDALGPATIEGRLLRPL